MLVYWDKAGAFSILTNIYMFSLDNAFFTFSLQAFPFANFTGVVPDPIELDEYLYFKVYVDTQSANPNLDLFIVECYSSSSNNPFSTVNRVNLIVDG